jgi:hypothetical protein
MQVRDVRRTAIDRWLKAARLPFDAATHLLPNGRGPRNTAGLVIDRADATIRAAVGGLLRDDDLRDDAARRRLAADERQRALVLRTEAEQKQREADTQLSEELAEAQRLREASEREAAGRAERADDKASRLQEAAQDAAAARAREVERARAQKTAAAEKRAKRERLEVLDGQAEALDEETDALTAKDEAQRLRRATAAAKRERKAGGGS